MHDWQEEEDKDDLDGTVSVISLRLIWVCMYVSLLILIY